MSLFGGKIGGTTDGWIVPDAVASERPSPDDERALLDSIKHTDVGAAGVGSFVSLDNRIGAVAVESVRVSMTDGGHEAISAEGRAIRVDWTPDVDGESYVFYLCDVEWKGRSGMIGEVRKELKRLAGVPARSNRVRCVGARSRGTGSDVVW